MAIRKGGRVLLCSTNPLSINHPTGFLVIWGNQKSLSQWWIQENAINSLSTDNQFVRIFFFWRPGRLQIPSNYIFSRDLKLQLSKFRNLRFRQKHFEKSVKGSSEVRQFCRNSSTFDEEFSLVSIFERRRMPPDSCEAFVLKASPSSFTALSPLTARKRKRRLSATQE